LETSNALHQIDAHDQIEVEEILRDANSNVVQLSHGQTPTVPGPSFEFARAPARRTAKPLLACAAIVMLLILPLLFESIEAWPARYDAGIGQRVFVPIEDHSTIELNTRTHLEVLYGPRSREVTLLSGEAIFDVRHDSSRPFRVICGDTVIEDVGTKFAVYRHADGTTTVTVLEGLVEITSGSAKERLQEDEVATVRRGRVAFQVESVEPREIRRQLSWEVGALSFEGQTLAQVIAEVNRYNERQLVIEDPTVASLRLGGTFQAVDLNAFLATLDSLFDVRAVPVPNKSNVIELQRRPEVQ
jgi:transmembrane sensor